MAAAETHPPAPFKMLSMDEYKLLLAHICPICSLHLGSIGPYIAAKFQFYLYYEFLKLGIDVTTRYTKMITLK